MLAASNAGNGPISADSIGAGGCRWSFCPHTAHNSYVLDVALAEEIERAVAGASVDSRALAVNKLRQRVREAAATDAPDWNLCNTTALSPDSRTVISVYQRTRPRGDWKNVKMTGVAAESARGFIKGMLLFLHVFACLVVCGVVKFDAVRDVLLLHGPLHSLVHAQSKG